MTKVFAAYDVNCVECDCQEVYDSEDETQFIYCPQCSFENARRKQLAAERTAAELRARIDNLEQEIAELRGELKMSYTSDDPRITVNEWQAETPYGQMLDGLGDEVEP